MDRNREDGLPPQHAEPDQRLTKPNETVDRDPKNVPAEPQNAEPRPAERPDLDWAEHED
jgi:hypothetical protein